MNLPQRPHVLAVTFYLAALLHPTSGVAFETRTHRLINESAAQGSPVLDQFLKDHLGFPQGLNTVVDEKSILEWIRIGGEAEDQYLGSEILGGLTRSPRHFHTPLRTWDQSGLNFFGTQFESSVRWAQDPNQSPGEKASWKDARDAYYAALTSSNQEDRERKFADIFQFLGQLMHLMADLASPPHTRNDPHLPGNSDGFEAFMGDPRNQGLIAGFEGIDSSVLQQPTGDPVAKVPIARLWDTDTYNGTNPEIIIGNTIGLAEFTSANFFSDDTISEQAFVDPDLPLPAIDRLSPGPIDFYPPTGEHRQYLSKLGDGVSPITHMVAEGLFFRFTPPFLFTHVLDDLVYQDYAPYLLPRAIGYSAGLLDYFFRGRIDLNNIQTPGQTPGSPVTSVQVNVKNITPDEETGSGEVTAVATFTTGGQQSFAVSSSQPVNLTRDFQEIVFDFGQNPIPADAFNPFLTVVYKGPLGLEEGAVVAQISKCPIPIQMQPGTFTTIDFPNADNTEATGVNNCGKIVGNFQDATGDHGFVLSGGVFTQIDFPNSWGTWVYGINDSDQIVGVSFGGFLFSKGVFTTIDVPGAMATGAFGINNAGQIVGTFISISTDGRWSFHGFLLSGGIFTTIDFPGALLTWATGINDAGQIVGSFTDNFTGTHGFVLSGGVFTQIDFPNSWSTDAFGINNAGQIVGSFWDATGTHGFVLSEGVFTQIDPPSSWWTQASGINNSGQIVGSFWDATGRGHGFLRNP